MMSALATEYKERAAGIIAIEDEAGEHRPQTRPGCDQIRHAAGVRN